MRRMAILKRGIKELEPDLNVPETKFKTSRSLQNK